MNKIENLNDKKKTITISIPEIYFDKITDLVKKEKYPSKSELVRIAIKNYLSKEFKNLKELIED